MLASIAEFYFPQGHPSYLVIGITLLLGYVIIRKILDRSKYAKYPPTVTGVSIPWFGHILSFGLDPVPFLMKQFLTVGEAFSFVLFGRDLVFLTGPQATDAFFNAPEEVLSAKDAYRFMIPAFGPGVVYDAPDEKFQQQRKMVGSALTIKAFKSYIPKMVTEVESFLAEHWGDSGKVDFGKVISEILIFTSTHCLQGPEIRAQVNQGYAGYMHDIDQALSTVGFFYPGLPLPAYRNRDVARRKLGAVFKAIINNRRAEKTPKEYDDVLDALMKASYPDGQTLSDNEIAGMLVALMLAGQHTSNVTSTWLAIYALSDPNIKKKLEEEQDRLGKEELTYDSVKDMVYLENCMKEVLRLRPPIILIFRKAIVDFIYKNYRVPAGTLVCVSPSAYALTDKSPFVNPLEYNPDRFNPDKQEDKKERYTYFPFSLGRHACIGEKFAFLQVKTVFSTILKHYDLELIGKRSDYPVDNSSLIACAKGPVMVQYRKRAQQK